MPRPLPCPTPLKLTVTFRDIADHLTDPASGIEIQVQAPDLTRTIHTYPGAVSREGEGVYSILIEGDQPGVYVARGQGVLANGMAVASPDQQSPTLLQSLFA